MNTLEKPKIGLLPLMLELYKTYSPELEDRQRPFIRNLSGALGRFSFVLEAPVCSTTAEVRQAVRRFEDGDIDIIVVLFISYAASISALNPLLETNIPLLLFSTAPKDSMAEGMTSGDITLNHGVHGCMDLANVLRRNGRPFVFVAGRKDDKAALAEIESWAKAAQVKFALRRSLIGIAGYTFDGMGDFGVDTTHLNAVLGPEVRHIPLHELAAAIEGVDREELERETAGDRERFAVAPDVTDDLLFESNRVYLGLSKIAEEYALNAFTMHFQGILENPGIRTPPFLAISKLQERGMAYAGEGDLLGATGNLLLRCLCGEAVFTETFCPDFDGGRFVMGHMGESNPRFGTETLLRRKTFRFGDAVDPVIADVRMEPGRATVLNLGIVEDGAFQMIAYAGEVCERVAIDGDVDMPCFHFRPDMRLEDFLVEYVYAGGTHHIGMTRGDRLDDLAQAADLLGVQLVILG